MTLHVVDSDEGELTGPGRGLGEGVADEERPHQPGAGGRAHAVEIGGMDTGFVESLMGERPDRLDVGTGRHLGHHPAEPRVKIDLGGEDVGECLGPLHHRHGRLVTRGLEGEDERLHSSRSRYSSPSMSCAQRIRASSSP